MLRVLCALLLCIVVFAPLFHDPSTAPPALAQPCTEIQATGFGSSVADGNYVDNLDVDYALSQSFTPTQSVTLSRVFLFITNAQATAQITVTVNAEYFGIPGTVLASGTVTPAVSSSGFVEVLLSPAAVLYSGTTYHLVASTTEPNGSSGYSWMGHRNGTYAGGSGLYRSPLPGGLWSPWIGGNLVTSYAFDRLFQVWGCSTQEPTPSPTPTPTATPTCPQVQAAGYGTSRSDSNDAAQFRGGHLGQSFIPTQSVTVHRVSLFMDNVGATAPLRVSLNADEGGNPGAELAAGTFTPTGAFSGFIDVLPSPQVALMGGAKYYVLFTNAETAGNYSISLNRTNPYPGGTAVQFGGLDNPGTWITVPTTDLLFQVWGCAASVPTATGTPTPLISSTPTRTPTNTPTATMTRTPTATAAGTSTATATATPNPFVVRTLDAAGQVGQYASLQLNGQNPVVAYRDVTETARDLKLAVCSDPTCQTAPVVRTIDTAGDVGSYASLQLNGGNPVIGYWDVSNRALKLAVCSDPTCAAPPTIRTLDSTGYQDGYVSLRLAGGNPVLSYLDGNQRTVKLAVCSDSTCLSPPVIRTVATADHTSAYISMELRGANPIIAFNEFVSTPQSQRNLNLAVCSDPTCDAPPTIRTVDSSGSSMRLSLGMQGDRPVVAYIKDFDLKLAVCGDPTCSVPPTLRTIPGVAASDLSLDASGLNPVIAYRRTIGGLSVAVCLNSICNGSFKNFLVDWSGVNGGDSDVGSHPSLRLNGDLPVVSYHANGSHVDLRLAACTSPACSVPPSNSTSTPTSTPTGTPTRTITPTHTPTRTPTNTRTPTPTRTPTLSPTATASATSTNTLTPTDTATPTITATPTNTVTPTQTATASVTPTSSLTPTSTPGLSPIVWDTFSRTVSPGWGNADYGGRWFLNLVAGITATNGGSIASVSGGRGRANVSASGASRYFTAVSGSTTAADYDVLATLNSGPTGSLFGALGRASVSGSYLAWMISGQNTIKLTTGAVPGPLGSGVLSSPVVANTDYIVRFQLQGTSLRARAWEKGSPEPTSWQVTATDNHVAAGLAGVMAGFPNTGSATFTFDEVKATTLVAGGSADATAAFLDAGPSQRIADDSRSARGAEPDPTDISSSLRSLSTMLEKDLEGEPRVHPTPRGGPPTVLSTLLPCSPGCPATTPGRKSLEAPVPDIGAWPDQIRRSILQLFGPGQAAGS